jgi:hypothetical protein
MDRELFGHVKGEWPHLEQLTDPAVLDAELTRVRGIYNGTRLHAGVGYVTPDDEHAGRSEQIRQAASRASGEPTTSGSPTIAGTATTTTTPEPRHDLGHFSAKLRA